MTKGDLLSLPRGTISAFDLGSPHTAAGREREERYRGPWPGLEKSLIPLSSDEIEIDHQISL